jgi:glycosyltransferase involved in cell wall biosynthesis
MRSSGDWFADKHKEHRGVPVPVLEESHIDAIKMKVLRCCVSLDPELGGSVEAIRQACLGLPMLGHTVEVACADAPEAPWLQTFPGHVYALGPAVGTYGYTRRFVPWLRKHADNYDAVVIDGVWGFPGLAAWLALRKSRTPYFVYTHGMLDPWFKRRYPLKHIKKWVYWILALYWILRDARAVIYTGEQERVLSRESFFWPPRVREVVAGLGVYDPPGDSLSQREMFFGLFPELRDKRIVLFMSRIHPKKGCDLLIEAFAKTSIREEGIHLVLVGPDQIGWQQELHRRVEKLGLESRVTWTGMLSGDAKWGAFRAAEVFILPSHAENFGLVIAEAMACGVPVLTTDKVNIWREIEASGGGFISCDSLHGVTELLERWLRLTADERESMAHRAREGFDKEFSLHVAVQKFISVIRASLQESNDNSGAGGTYENQLRYR